MLDALGLPWHTESRADSPMLHFRRSAGNASAGHLPANMLAWPESTLLDRDGCRDAGVGAASVGLPTIRQIDQRAASRQVRRAAGLINGQILQGWACHLELSCPVRFSCRILQKHRQDDLSQCTVGRRKPAAGQAAGQPRWQPGALRRPALQHLCSSVQGRLCEAHRLEWRPAGVLET